MDNNYKKFLLGNSKVFKIKSKLRGFLLFFVALLSFQSNLFAQITSVSLTPTNPQCAEYDNGSILVTVVGGTAPYTYLWNDGFTSSLPTRPNLKAGTYSVVVTDNVGATFPAQSSTLTDPAKMQAIGAGLGVVDVDCFGKATGSIEISILNSVGTVTYKWTKNGVIVGGNSPKLPDISAGTYSLLATDSRGCFTAPTFPISQPTEIIVSEVPGSHVNNTDFGQNNGVIKLNVTGGVSAANPTPTFTYLWNDGNTDKERSGLASGTYTVTVTDNKGCSKIYESKILPLSPFLVTGESTNNKCFASPNGSITIAFKDGVPPYKFKWSDQATFVNNPNRSILSAGTYTLTAQDANGLGAIRTLSFTITEPPLLSFTKTFTSNKCFDQTSGVINLEVTGGVAPYRYILNGVTSAPFTDNNVSIPNLASRNYSVSIIDNGGCPTPAQSVDILPLKALAFKKQQPVLVRCNDDFSGAIIVTVEGGLEPYTYKWSNDVNNNTNENRNIPEGSYSLIVSDALGCILPTYTVNLTREASAVTIEESTLVGTHIDNTCFNNADGTLQKNGKASIIITGGLAPYTYTWLLDEQAIPSPTDRDLSATTLSVDNLASGKYKLVVTDKLGCASLPLTIDIKPIKPINSNPIIKNEKCLGKKNGEITLNPTGGTPPYTYVWGNKIPLAQRGNSTVSSLAPDTYTLRIFDFKNCLLDTAITILPATPVEISDEIRIILPNCDGSVPFSTIKVPIEGGEPDYTYTWSTADPKTGAIIANLPAVPENPLLPNDIAYREGLPAGYYVLTVTDANGCETKLPKFDVANVLNAFEIKAVSCGAANNAITPDPLMSPNGDGINDFFSINGIENFPDNQVIIYNRYGTEVFTRKRYNNVDRIFKGIANSAVTNTGVDLVDGVYFYTIRTVQDKKPRLNKGYIIIKR